MSTLVTKTIPTYYLPDQKMYPGAPLTCNGHEIYFSGLEGQKYGQLWIKDVVYGYFRQLTGSLDLSQSKIILAIWALATPKSTLCFIFSDGTKSNVFSCEIGYDRVISGGSVNLGEAPKIFSMAQAYDAGLLGTTPTTTTTTTTVKKKGR